MKTLHIKKFSINVWLLDSKRVISPESKMRKIILLFRSVIHSLTVSHSAPSGQ